MDMGLGGIWPGPEIGFINSQILLQPKRICYVLLNTDTEDQLFLWQTHTPADEFF